MKGFPWEKGYLDLAQDAQFGQSFLEVTPGGVPIGKSDFGARMEKKRHGHPTLIELAVA